MKTLRFIGMAIIAIIMGVNFAACSSDSDNTEEPLIDQLSVHVSNAGTLESLIENKQRYNIRELILSGYLNGVDVTYIIETFKKDDCKLEKLDLSNVQMLGGRYKNLAGDELSSSRNEIGESMFAQILNLKSIKLPSSITKICRQAFANSAVTSLEIPNGVIEIEDLAFYNTPLTSILIPKSVTKIGMLVFDFCLEMSKISVSSDNEYYMSIDDILFNKEKTVLVYYPANKAGNSYTIPDNISSINHDAFACTNLTSIVIPSSVTKIGNGAFCNSSISTIIIPKSVTEIGYCAFGGKSLKEAHFLSSIPPKLVNDNKSGLPVSYCDSFGFADCNIYIPKGSYDIYKASYAFKKYDNIIEE